MQTERVKPMSSLKAWRRAKGFTTREAARHLGISQGFYQKIETRKAFPRPTIAKSLTDQTGVPLDELLGIAE